MHCEIYSYLFRYLPNAEANALMHRAENYECAVQWKELFRDEFDRLRATMECLVHTWITREEKL